MIELKGVSKRFDGTEALRSVDLRVESGRTTVLIGPSGCGKSTLLRLMNGLLFPDDGEVILEGRPITPTRALEVRRRIGYVIQDGGLFPHLTARRNIVLMADYLGWDTDRQDARVRELTELTRFPEDALERFPSQLSGGQAQRVALMRALMLEPELLLLDEPLGALDPMVRSDLQEDLKEIFAALEATVVLVTHDLSEAAFFADHVVLMRAGGVVQQGTAAELIEEPASEFVSRFVRAQRVTAWPATEGGS